MIPHARAEGIVAVLQSAHALMSFQIADHWGNRTTPRPSPRADVLAAVLLHDSGWDGNEDPSLAEGGAPVDFTSIPGDEQERLWSAAVERASIRGRYVGYLVSHHVSHLAARYSTHPHADFLAREERRRQRLRAELADDPRYEPALQPAADAVNRSIVRLADALAVHLLLGVDGDVELADLPQRDGPEPLLLRRVGERSYRLRPWPLAGRRLAVHAEGRALPRATFDSDDALRAAWSAASTCRLSWTLLAPGAPER